MRLETLRSSYLSLSLEDRTIMIESYLNSFVNESRKKALMVKVSKKDKKIRITSTSPAKQEKLLEQSKTAINNLSKEEKRALLLKLMNGEV